MKTTGIGGSVALIALGAVMAWAVSVETEGFNINTAGLIIFAVGILGLVATLVMASTADKTVVEKDVTNTSV